MSKKYDHRLVHSYRSYKTRDVCRLFRGKKLHEQTVRGWVNDGKMKAIWHGKTLYIYGAVLKEFLQDKNRKSKRKLEFNQFKCWKCKTIDTPFNNTIEKLTTGRSKCILAHAICEYCEHEMHRNYKRAMEQEILKCFTVKHNELRRLYDSSCDTRKTNIIDTLEMASSESSEANQPEHKENPNSVAKNTSIATKQLNLF